MANTQDLVLEQLRAIRSTLDDHGERLGRIETRLSSIERRLEITD